jgi:CheY-like chemotaxis protein
MPKKRVLLVDDNAVVRSTVRPCLTPAQTSKFVEK